MPGADRPDHPQGPGGIVPPLVLHLLPVPALPGRGAVLHGGGQEATVPDMLCQVDVVRYQIVLFVAISKTSCQIYALQIRLHFRRVIVLYI